ncbi:MAG: cyclophane-forming radical SAM/SPASM peptide maturase GrrM/OscB [Pleurocapsa sp. MO_226.B13]|nr:cyclophane-forming radical SAM/SPASM peptide maturase GrrM/OscB [Pleurocapsa sp. MO_226.B13]
MNKTKQIPKAALQKTQFGSVKLIVIQPTPFCNLNCDYCYLPDRRSKYRLSLDLLEPIFKNLFQSQFIGKEFTVVWHAGEPLTMPISFYESAFDKIDQLNREFNSSRCSISHALQTNGTLINQAWCNLIKKYRVKVGVSLDGPAFIHDAHRKTRKGLGTHASTMRGISLLQANKIDFSVIAVLTNNSLNFPEAIFDFFMEHQMRNVGFNIEETEGANESSSLAKDSAEERYRAFMQRLYELTKSTNGYLKVREFEQIKNFIYEKCNALQGQFTPFTMINIAYNGDFSTFSPELLSMKSSDYGDFILGNVQQDSFDSICHTDKFNRINRDIQAGVNLCKRTCQYYSLCGGGAPSNKYFENGSFATSETMYCRYTKKVITDIVLEDIEKDLGLHPV